MSMQQLALLLKVVTMPIVSTLSLVPAELPIRLAHRVAELENLPYGLSAKPHVLKACHRSRCYWSLPNMHVYMKVMQCILLLSHP